MGVSAGKQMDNVSSIPLTDDQHFLLHLITGSYFAPNLKVEKARKPALQRRSENFPPYDANDLTGSRMRTSLIESVYYHILRKAEPSVCVSKPCFLRYIHGARPVSGGGSSMYPSFDDLFPPELHARSHDAIDNIIFIDNPNIDYIAACDIERFKNLTGLEDLRLDRESEILHVFEDLYDVKVPKEASSNSTIPLSCSTCSVDPVSYSTTQSSQMDNSFGEENIDQGLIFFPSCPSREEWSDVIASVKSGFAVSGSAAKGHVGPILGLMDIGESEDSYLFRVSLPGVRRDERDFSCEVESDGTVIIKGVTVTGEKIVEKCEQTFEMQSQNLCPPGPFSISFKLPGRVDPHQFHGTFAADGILEGIAFKVRDVRVKS